MMCVGSKILLSLPRHQRTLGLDEAGGDWVYGHATAAIYILRSINDYTPPISTRHNILPGT